MAASGPAVAELAARLQRDVNTLRDADKQKRRRALAALSAALLDAPDVRREASAAAHWLRARAFADAFVPHANRAVTATCENGS